ncbi:reverse transcriptase domain-containing protein [Tanacetum coccineum]
MLCLLSMRRVYFKKAATPQVMVIQGGSIHKTNKKLLNAKGKGNTKGNGKDKSYIPKPKNPKPSAKEHPTKDDTCHNCKDVGHCKRNCPAYLVELIKKKEASWHCQFFRYLRNLTYRASTPPTQAAPSNELTNYMKAMMLQQNNKLENMLSSYFQMNKPSGLSSGPLPSNTVTNPKGDLKAITTQSGVSYDGPLIPPIFSPSPKVVEKEPEVTKDPVHSSAEKVQPSDVQPQAPTSKPVNAPKPKPNIPYPSRLNNQNLRERDDHQMMKFLQIFRSLHFNLSFSDALLYMPKFASTFKNLLSNKEKLFEVANTLYSQEVLGFSGNSESGNPTPTSEPIIAKSSPSLTLFEGGDFMLEEIEANLASDSVPSGIDEVNIIDFFSTFPIPVEDSDFFFEKPETFPSELETFRFDAKENNSDGTTIHANVYLLRVMNDLCSEGDIISYEKFLDVESIISSPCRKRLML